jgi:threonine dehydratase
MMLNPQSIQQAHTNIKNLVFKTPVIFSSTLNNMLGHKIYFKIESQQKTGAYKVRGAFNTLVELQKNNSLPKKITAYSTGNHAVGLAYAAKKFGIEIDLYLPSFTSKMKQTIAKSYGANIIITKTRAEAEEFSKNAAKNSKNIYHIPPSDLDTVIQGAGTVVFEALKQENDFDAIFVPVGGGGLASGSFLAKELLSAKSKLFLGEPKQANDLSISLKQKKIFRFERSPETIADGAKTLGVSSRIFEYLKKCDGLFEISEREIIYWNAWFIHLTKIVCEPTSALAIAAAYRWLKKQTLKKKILIIITGGNLDSITYNKIWAEDYLVTPPQEFIFDEE